MKNNNPKKPFFKTEKKETGDSKGFKGGFKKKSTNSEFDLSEVEKKGFGKKSSFAGKKDGPAKSFDRKEKENRFEKSPSTDSSKKKFFKKSSDSDTDSRNQKPGGFGAKRFSSGNEKRSEKPFKKDFKSGKPSEPKKEEGQVYKGRGKDQRPIYEPGTPVYKKESKGPKGFGKNRFVDQDTNLDRPDYKFDSLPSKKKKLEQSEEGLLRLNKFISNSGICGRREADQLIAQGLITVNGEICTEMGRKVKRTDRVVYQGRKINPEKPVYVLLNKPKDFITTTEDPMDRKTVMNLVGNACEERIFPVGRLDRNTTGLLLFTNDGELAAKLSHPSNEIKKIYQVTLDKPLTKNDEEAIIEGLTLEDGKVTVDDLQVLSLDRKIMGLEIHVGRNRIVRRIFAHLGYDVTALDRVIYAGLDKKDLKRGHYRFLSEQEVIRLKFFI
jgi:23S rRNA pseudouridine2605 synthase